MSGGGGTARRDYGAGRPSRLAPLQPLPRGGCQSRWSDLPVPGGAMVSRVLAAVPILAALTVTVVPAQSAADARWLAQCREHGDESRIQHCEVRIVTLARGGAIGVDPGPNGAVAVEGWGRDSIEVHARVETHAAAAEEALALARELRIVTAGRASSPPGRPPRPPAVRGGCFVTYAPR